MVPSTSENQKDFFDDYVSKSELPTSFKSRSNSSNIVPIPTNAWLKMMKHLNQAEHVINLSREYEKLNRFINNRSIKKTIENKYGKDVFNTIQAQVDNLSLQKHSEQMDAISGAMGFLVNNWVTSKVALNPNVFVKQLISTGNYMENMPVKRWMKHFGKGIKSHKATFDFMWDNAPFLKARFNRGYNEAMRSAVQGAENINPMMGDYTKFLSSLVRGGDVTAIIYGGYPVIMHEMEVNGKSLEEAVKIFERQTLKAQQSGLTSDRSLFQNSRNPLARLFLAFKNTPSQYFRKNVDALITYYNGDSTKAQMAKTLAIYSLIQPALYGLAGYAMKKMWMSIGNAITGRKDEEDDTNMFQAMLSALLVNPFMAIPILDDIANYAARKVTGQKAWKVFSTPLLDDIESGIRTIQKENITGFDFLEIIGSFVEPIVPAPIKTYTRIGKYLFNKEKKESPKIGG